MLLLLGCRAGLVSSAEPGSAAAWDRFLEEHVHAGRIDWAALEEDRAPLDGYVAELARPASFGGRIKADRHAMWLNAVTALSLFQILEVGSTDVSDPGWLPFDGSAFFVETAFDVGGEWVSLSEIVHERLRMKELDYRDHAAMYFGNLGGPPLRPGLYETEAIGMQLDDAMRRWVAAGAVEVVDGQAVFADRFDRYERDFVQPDREVSLCALVAPYLDAPGRRAIEQLDRQGCPHRFLPEDSRVLRR